MPDSNAQKAEPLVAEATLSSLEPVLRAEVIRLRTDALASQTDDLVQAGLLRLSRTLERGQPVNKAYVKRVAWSVTVDGIRRARRTADQPTPEGTEALDRMPGGRSPEDQAVLGQIRIALRDCLAALAVARQDAITLYLLGHTIRESSERLGITNKQADNKIYRGLASLRDCLRRKGVQP